jgi:hypothetical protein
MSVPNKSEMIFVMKPLKLKLIYFVEKLFVPKFPHLASSHFINFFHTISKKIRGYWPKHIKT